MNNVLDGDLHQSEGSPTGIDDVFSPSVSVQCGKLEKNILKYYKY